MDIHLPINTQSPLASNKLMENALSLKVGQQLDVKVIGTDILAAKNAITLTLGDKDITLQSNQPITLNSGQNLKVQVTQITPAIEFKILDTLLELKAKTVQLQNPNNQPTELRLKLIPTARDSGSVAIGKEPMQEIQQSMPSPSPIKPLLDAKIINIIGTKIQLQVFTNTPIPSIAETDNKQPALINIDRTQLTNAPSDLKVGQNLNLEIIKAGTAPEFKIIPAVNNIPEAKIAEFIKQFLPRHEAAPLFLNQLIKDLPKLMKNESVPQTLKDMAAKIIQNLPPKEQLITSQGLKQSIVNSGLFLEAKLPPAMAQAEIVKDLPQLIKNESVPQSLQRIAAEILQSLSPKQPVTNSKLISEAKLGLNTADGGIDEEDTSPNKRTLEQRLDKLPSTPKAGELVNAMRAGEKAALPGTIMGATAEDFKANLLKFIHALKQELTTQGLQQQNPVDLDLLKNLQNKTENTVAKLVLDQLMSLPKEDNPKQQWIIDIPFIDRQQAESVKIEIQRDKENKKQSGSNDWSVNITIQPPELGTIHCMVSYRNDVINTFFKSQNSQTTELIKHNLDYLKNQLEESGLTTGHMDAHNGSQKKQPLHQLELSEKKLFDDNA
jgi:flagellar hook-length control protein FliK